MGRGRCDEHGITRTDPLLEQLRDEHVLPPLLEQRRTIEDHAELDEPREKMARQGEPPNRGVLALGVFGMQLELG